MSMAHGDYEKIMNFAISLEQYLNNVEEETGKLNSAFQSLKETWNDEKRASFEDIFNQLMATLAVFKENSNEQIPYLRTLSERLKAYIQT